MNPRIYFMLSHFVDEMPDIDLLSITYEDGKVTLKGAKDSEQDWSWKEEVPLDFLYPMLPLLTNEDFHYKLGKEEFEEGKLYSYKTKQLVKRIDAVIPVCITVTAYDYGIEKNAFGEELSNLLRSTFYVS